MSLLKKLLHFIWHIEWRDFDFDSKKEISFEQFAELRKELHSFKGTSVQLEKFREEFYKKQEDKVVRFIATVDDVYKGRCGRGYDQYFFGIKVSDHNGWNYKYINCSEITCTQNYHDKAITSTITMRQDFDLKAFGLNIGDQIICTVPFDQAKDQEIWLGKLEKIGENKNESN